MKYKAIFFDLDGVLTTNHSGGGQMCQHLAETLNVRIDDVKRVYEPFGKRLGSGQAQYSEVIAAMSEAFGQSVTMEHVQGAFDSSPKNEAMFDLANDLKNRVLIVGVITDNDKERFQALKDRLALDEIFSPLILSADVGMFKHDAGIFTHALNAAGVSAAESIFIDNKQGNLEAANNLGMTTIWFDDSKNDVDGLRQELDQLLA